MQKSSFTLMITIYDWKYRILDYFSPINDGNSVKICTPTNFDMLFKNYILSFKSHKHLRFFIVYWTIMGRCRHGQGHMADSEIILLQPNKHAF